MIRVFSILLSVSLFLLASCEKEQSERSEGKYADKKILCVVKTLDNPYFSEMVKGFKEASQKSEFGYSLIIRSGSAEGDVDGQRKILENFFVEDVTGRKTPNVLAVILTPASSGDALVPEIKKYRESNIPVIVVDTPILEKSLEKFSTDVTVFIASDNKGGARKAAEELLQFMEKKSSVLLLNGLDGHETAGLRREGFLEGLNSSEISDFELTERTCDWERSKARETVEALLSVGNVYDVLFAANDQMAIGALEAFKQRNADMSKTRIIGFDAIPQAKQLVDDGMLYATMQQNPQQMGKIAVETVEKILSGSSFEPHIQIEVLPYKQKGSQ